MCVSALTIYNKSNHLSFNGNAFMFEVPCGKCEECREAKRQEYLMRSWFEYLDTVKNKDGFVYFDTLTYSNKYLPRYQGRPCFNKKHLKDFLKKLRVYLERANYEVKGNLKYFITSELGGKTHRPHYHILLFCSIPNIDVKRLWRFVNKAWNYGIIDRYKTCPNRVVNSSAALAYVAKYVAKDQEFSNYLDSLHPYLKTLYLEKKEFQPFHLQSQGFGANFMRFCSIDDILKKGYITVLEKGFLKKYFLPDYYKRKLFYYCDKEDDGKLRWHLTEFGKEWKCNLLEYRIQRCEQHFRDIYYNLGILHDPQVKEGIDRLLDNRTLREFAEYVSVYRNKMWINDELPSVREFYRLGLEEGNEDNLFYGASNEYFKNLVRKFTINQFDLRYYERFHNFDYLLGLFRHLPQRIAQAREKQAKEIEELRSRLKLVLITN